MKLLSKKYDYILNVHAKSGCTVLRQLFLCLHREELNSKQNKKLRLWHNVQIIFKPEIGTDLPKLTINCIRNPYDRVVSMFTNKMVGDFGILNKKIKLEKITFRNFVKHLKYLSDNKRLDTFDDHVKSQTFDYNEDDIIVIVNGKLQEQLVDIYENNSKLKPLVSKINIFFDKSIDRNCTKKTTSGPEFIGDIIYKTEYNGPWPNTDNFYDQDIRTMVESIYVKDLEIYNCKMLQ